MLHATTGKINECMLTSAARSAPTAARARATCHSHAAACGTDVMQPPVTPMVTRTSGSRPVTGYSWSALNITLPPKT